MSHYCFITGFLRSGTTLVEKLVHSLPGACIGPQPFPFLFHDVKRAFLRTLGGGAERYPLGHLFREARYGPEDFERFLAHHRITREDLESSFARMDGYSGWKLPALASHVSQVAGGSLGDTYRALCDRLPSVLGGEPTLLGAKEVFCEEFLPYFLRNGVELVLVVRDIRDVLTSLKLGAGDKYVDAGLPALHVVRQWRKSVAFALELEGRRGFHLVRYEELVARPQDTLGGLARRLGLDATGADPTARVVGQDGTAWEGNSSFGTLRGVTSEGVGRFAEKLPASWLSLVEALCEPEMRAMGYSTVHDRTPDDRALEEALEQAGGDLTLVGAGETCAEEVDAERERNRLLARRDISERDQQRWFIFPRVYRRLADHTPAR